MDKMYYVPPFRLGRKQKRAILDSNGELVSLLPKGKEKEAEFFCDYLNSKNS